MKNGHIEELSTPRSTGRQVINTAHWKKEKKKVLQFGGGGGVRGRIVILPSNLQICICKLS